MVRSSIIVTLAAIVALLMAGAVGCGNRSGSGPFKTAGPVVDSGQGFDAMATVKADTRIPPAAKAEVMNKQFPAAQPGPQPHP